MLCIQQKNTSFKSISYVDKEPHEKIAEAFKKFSGFMHREDYFVFCNERLSIKMSKLCNFQATSTASNISSQLARNKK